MKRTDKNKAYHRLDAETALRERCFRLAADVMRIMPNAFTREMKVLDFVNVIHAFIKGLMQNDINELPSDIAEGIMQKYKEKYVDPYEDLT